jgi:CRISPR/Cas system-associated protein Cas5 (RAMP superfamily)
VLKKQGKLGDIVVFALGTNSIFRMKEAKEAVRIVGKNRYVVFVTGYVKGKPFTNISNKAVRKLAKGNARVFVADWNKFISGKKNKKLSDNSCHLTKTSSLWYSGVIEKSIKAARSVRFGKITKTLIFKVF